MPHSELQMEPFRVRLNCLDHYQGDPSEFDPPLAHSSEASRNYARPKVPIIRAFGATETGQKVCAHIHGAFPYLYVEYKGGLESRSCQFKAINQLETKECADEKTDQ